MPLNRGKGGATIAKNIAELHRGKKYASTKEKFGQEKADRQAVAIALRKAGKSRIQKSRIRKGK